MLSATASEHDGEVVEEEVGEAFLDEVVVSLRDQCPAYSDLVPLVASWVAVSLKDIEWISRAESLVRVDGELWSEPRFVRSPRWLQV